VILRKYINSAEYMRKSLLSNRVLQMQESETLKMAQLARELNAQGYQIINLSLGEPDFDTPISIKEAAKLALDQGFTKYTPVAGIPDLRAAISKKFSEVNQLNYRADEIVVSNGAKQSIANICQAMLNPGDEVVVFTPYWVSYIAIIELAGGIPVCISAGVEKDYKPSAEDLESAITSNTKLVLFSSPCNPTGTVFEKSDLEAYAEVLNRYPEVVVISDEIYEEIIFDKKHISIGSLPGLEHRTITVNGFSKSYSMTGWRLGYMGAPKEIADACAKIQGQFTSGANSFAQKAAVFAIQHARQEARDMKEKFQERRDLMLELMTNIPGFRTNKPDGAFYLFPDCSSYFGKSSEKGIIADASDLCDYLLMDAHVALVSGSAFGADNCIRISYATSVDQLEIAMERIGKSLSKLK
jgi:aspartate aminotransferase